MTKAVTPPFADEYLIRKNGYYYRPNAQGYTLCVADAGRFSLDEAIKHSHPNGPNGPRDGITYEPAPTIDAGEVPPFPDCLTGHWDTAEGREMAEQYLKEGRHQQGKGEMSDMALANAVFMADRCDLDLIVWQTAAKERIRWLSAQLAAANRLLVHEGRPTSGEEMRLREGIAKFLPTNIDIDNSNIADDVILPMDVTMGELRALASLAKGAD